MPPDDLNFVSTNEVQSPRRVYHPLVTSRNPGSIADTASVDGIVFDTPVSINDLGISEVKLAGFSSFERCCRFRSTSSQLGPGDRFANTHTLMDDRTWQGPRKQRARFLGTD